MSAFQKRKTKREIKILGKWYSVDFGRDDISIVLKRVQVQLKKIEEKVEDGCDETKSFAEMIKEEKRVLKDAIGEILGCPDEVSSIFEGDDTIILHRDIYTYLVEKYIDVLKAKSPYDVERIEGYYEPFD